MGKVSNENLRNDMVDVNFAAFATYFDGLLADDKRAADAYARSEYLLQEMFATAELRAQSVFSMG